MLIRLACLLVVVTSWVLPSAAYACSCARPPADLRTALRTERADATAIYRARITQVDSRGFGGNASAEVLEVFKGKVKAGDTLEVPSGGGGDCSIRFQLGTEYLMYAHGKEPGSVSHCSRTRPVSEGDSELAWLRTGKLPPVPVALQREAVSCEPCDIFAVGGRLIAAPGAPPGSWDWEPQAEDEMKAGRPFFTNSASASDGTRHVMVGMSFDGKTFELTQTPHHSADGACRQQVQLRWCKRLDVSTPGPEMYPRFQCVEPGEASLQCDESPSRKASWKPVEALPKKPCNWYSPDTPECVLEPRSRVLPKGAPRSPLLVCRPQPGTGGGRRHTCRVEEKPRPTDQAR